MQQHLEMLKRQLDEMPADHPERQGMELIVTQGQKWLSEHRSMIARLSKGEINLHEEWSWQAYRLAAVFSEHLGLSGEDYLSNLPKFTDEGKLAGFDYPLLVQPPQEGIDLEQMLKLAGIENLLGTQVQNIGDWEGDPSGFTTPHRPYTTWMSFRKEVVGVRDSLKDYPGIRLGTIYEGIALVIQNPGLIESNSLSISLSILGSQHHSRIPYLTIYRNLLSRVVENPGPQLFSHQPSAKPITTILALR